MDGEKLDHKINDVMICSFFTAGTGYEAEAKRLILSLGQVCENFDVQKVSNLGNWMRNTHFKAHFVKHMFAKYPNHDIVWIDCDAFVHSYPAIFEQLDADFAAHFRNWEYGRNELLSGTVFFKNNPLMHKVVDEWIGINKHHPNKWDQKNLQRVISRHDHMVRIYRLPKRFCLIHDDPSAHKVDPVITHYQASRKFKKKLK